MGLDCGIKGGNSFRQIIVVSLRFQEQEKANFRRRSNRDTNLPARAAMGKLNLMT